MTPMSPQVSAFEIEIDRVQAAVQHAQRLVLAAIGRGEFGKARRHVSEGLASAVPDSPRVAQMENRIGQVQADVQRAEQEIADAVNRAEFEAARKIVKKLADLTPNSPRVSRLRASIDEAQGSALRSGELMSAAIERGDFEGSPASREGAGGDDSGLAAGAGDERDDRSGAGDRAAYRAGGGGRNRPGCIRAVPGSS